MIQRVQTLFLLAATLLMLLIFAWPLATYYSDTLIITVNVYNVKTLSAQPGSLTVSPILTGFISLLAIASAALSVYTISRFRNRGQQLKMTRINLILTIVFIVVIFAVTDFIRKATGISPEYGTSVFFPVVALMFQMLAMRFIKKDEELVKSADRLR